MALQDALDKQFDKTLPDRLDRIAKLLEKNDIKPEGRPHIGKHPVILIHPVANMPSPAQRDQRAAAKVDIEQCPVDHEFNPYPIVPTLRASSDLSLIACRTIVVNDPRLLADHDHASAANHVSVLVIAPRNLNPPARLRQVGIDAKLRGFGAVAYQTNTVNIV